METSIEDLTPRQRDRLYLAVLALNGILASLSTPVAQQLYQRQADKSGVTARHAHVQAAYEYADLMMAQGGLAP